MRAGWKKSASPAKNRRGTAGPAGAAAANLLRTISHDLRTRSPASRATRATDGEFRVLDEAKKQRLYAISTTTPLALQLVENLLSITR
jgi:K+-sensing histidine kinase KdpD